VRQSFISLNTQKTRLKLIARTTHDSSTFNQRHTVINVLKKIANSKIYGLVDQTTSNEIDNILKTLPKKTTYLIPYRLNKTHEAIPILKKTDTLSKKYSTDHLINLL